MNGHIVDSQRGRIVVNIHIKLNREPCVGGAGEVVLSATNFEVSGTAVSEITLQCPLVEQNVLDVEISSAAGRGYIVIESESIVPRSVVAERIDLIVASGNVQRIGSGRGLC